MDGSLLQQNEKKKEEDSRNFLRDFHLEVSKMMFFIHFSLTWKQGIKFIDKTSMISLIMDASAAYTLQGKRLRLYVTEAVQGKQLNHQIALCWQEMPVDHIL